MKMKYLFIQLLVFFALNTTVAQVVKSYHNSNYYGAMYIPSGDSNIALDLSIVKGSPYDIDKFQLGKVLNNLTGESQTFYIRYNIFNDVVELKETPNSPKISGLVNSLNIYAKVNSKEYHYELYETDKSKNNEGYFILLNKGKNISLYLQKSKEFKDKVIAKDSYHKEKLATFKDSEKFYFNKDKTLVELSSKKKVFLKQFPEYSNEVSKYMKSEKIDLRSEKDLIKLFNYLDTLLK